MRMMGLLILLIPERLEPGRDLERQNARRAAGERAARRRLRFGGGDLRTARPSLHRRRVPIESGRVGATDIGGAKGEGKEAGKTLTVQTGNFYATLGNSLSVPIRRLHLLRVLVSQGLEELTPVWSIGRVRGRASGDDLAPRIRRAGPFGRYSLALRSKR